MKAIMCKMIRIFGKIAVRGLACALAMLLAASAGGAALQAGAIMPFGAVAWAEGEGASANGAQDAAAASQADDAQGANGADSASDTNDAHDSVSAIAQLSEYYLANDSFLTPVRLQNPWGSCWAFAIAAALESSILKAQAKLADPAAATAQNTAPDSTKYAEPLLTNLNTEVDISERAIAWFAHELQTEASAGEQAGEGVQRANANDPTTQMAGGSFTVVEAMLTARQAIVAESSAPYEYSGYSPGSLPWYALPESGAGDARSMDWSLPDILRTSNDVGWEVRDVLHLASPATSQYVGSNYTYQGYNADATQKIKETLAGVGAVAIALSTDTNLPQEVIDGRSSQAQPSEHLTYSTWSQYDSRTSLSADHAVTIVGWDDSYSASNFAGTASGQPPANGAWLCKNDWGSDALFAELGAADDSLKWGITAEDGSSTGFFWLSYYDHTISAPTAFVVQPTSEGYDFLYQYDYLSNSEFYIPTSYNQDIWVANVFTANDTELLKAVSAQTFDEGGTVKVKVCTISGESEDADILDAARVVYEAEESFATAGFHTIDLEQPVLLAQGQRFAVMESVASGAMPDSRYLSLELAFTDDPAETGMDTFARVGASEGETYVNLYGEAWVSLADFSTWYSDYCAENGIEDDIVYGNALIKAYSDKTTMGKYSNQTYGLVKL